MPSWSLPLGLIDTASMGSAKAQEYRISESDRFESGSFVKLFTWAAKKPKPIIHPVGKRMFAFARMNRLFGPPGISYASRDWCINGTSFTPLPNSRYRIVQTGSPCVRCELSITDMATGIQLEGVEPVTFPADTATK